MSSATSRDSSTSQHLRGTSEILQSLAFGTNLASTTLGKAETDGLKQETFEVLRLNRSLKNGLAPINRIPPEILTLIPDFWDMDYGSKDPVALTHVCRAWREIFISRSSLWTNFDCMNADKTRVYLERSRSSPVNLWLNRDGVLPPHDPFFHIIPFAFGRLESLFVRATPGNLQDITAHLFRPTPILKRLSINGGCEFQPYRNPVLTTALFNGDLSPLHVLHLQCVRTELPWRNMVNLTSFTLLYTSPAEPSIDQLLDFFKSALRLHEINLQLTTSASPTQSGQLVSLAYLKKMYITGDKPPSLLLNHLLIPVGAMLTTKISYYYSPIEGHLPRSLGNLKNLYNFTKISLRVDGVCHTCDLPDRTGKSPLFLWIPQPTPPGWPLNLWPYLTPRAPNG